LYRYAAGAKAAAAASSVAGAAAGVGAGAKKLGDGMDVYDGFADISSAASRGGAIVAGK
jgi:hypothetical protein